MDTLFPIEPNTPPGFTYTPGFLTEKEESQLITAITRIELKNMIFQGFEAKRKTASFGFDWSFDKRTLSKGKPIPAEFDWLVYKVARHLNLATEEIAELLLTEYPPGSMINWHRDAPPFDIVIGISLLSDCVFKFRPYDKTNRDRKQTKSLEVLRRSMYIMKGESRSKWEHCIAAVKEKRYSITLRTLV